MIPLLLGPTGMSVADFARSDHLETRPCNAEQQGVVDAVLADLRAAPRLKTGPPCSHVIQGPAGTGKSNVIRHIMAASGTDFAACTIDMWVPPSTHLGQVLSRTLDIVLQKFICVFVGDSLL